MKPISIISYNVNGIRAALKRDLANWLAEKDPDVFCIQEAKAREEQVDLAELEALGYQHYWHTAEKKGYSGVTTFSKSKPDYIEYGCGIAEYDKEGRVLRTDFGDLTILNVYFPSATSGDIRLAVKYRFMDDMLAYLTELRASRPKVVLCGDYNIAHKEIDIHNPKGLSTTSGFLPEERAWLSRYFESGMIDTFRFFHKDPHQYSWWSYRAGARQRNKGWRIDYIAATENLANNLVEADIFQDAVHSDHCPLYLKLNP